jgi:hypothetical protein
MLRITFRIFAAIGLSTLSSGIDISPPRKRHNNNAIAGDDDSDDSDDSPSNERSFDLISGSPFRDSFARATTCCWRCRNAPLDPRVVILAAPWQVQTVAMITAKKHTNRSVVDTVIFFFVTKLECDDNGCIEKIGCVSYSPQ